MENSNEYYQNFINFQENIKSFVNYGILEIPCGVTQITNQIQNYYDSNTIRQIKIPDTVKYIGTKAFYGCKQLMSIDLPNSITYIGEQAFRSCGNITQIILPSNLKFISSYTFQACQLLKKVVLQEGIQYIGEGAFEDCANLQSINIPSSVSVLKTLSFDGCTNLQNVKFNYGIIIIESKSFKQCTSLKSIVLPDSLLEIQEYAFYNCNQLTSIIFSKNLLTIGQSAFENCGSLEKIILPENIKYIQESAFAQCTSVSEIYLPNSLYSIQNVVFKKCNQLKYVNIPGNVKQIKGGAFSSCISLEHVDIQYGVPNMDINIFYSCDSLKNVNVPESITDFRSGTFAYAKQLNCIYAQENVTFSCKSDNNGTYPTFLQTQYDRCSQKEGKQYDTERCPTELIVKCTNTQNDFKKILSNQSKVCIDKRQVFYYNIQNTENMVLDKCPENESHFTNEYPPYQCVQQCQSQQYYDHDNKYHCVKKCQINQYIQQKEDGQHCQYECDEQYQYIQNNICVKQCTENYAIQQESNICNNTCNYQSFINDQQSVQNMCLIGEQCEQEYIKIKSSQRFQCIQKCPGNSIYNQQLLQCTNKNGEIVNTNGTICNDEQIQDENKVSISAGGLIGVIIGCIILSVGITLVSVFICLKKKNNKQFGGQKGNKKQIIKNKNEAKFQMLNPVAPVKLDTDKLESQKEETTNIEKTSKTEADKKKQQAKDKKSKIYM